MGAERSRTQSAASQMENDAAAVPIVDDSLRGLKTTRQRYTPERIELRLVAYVGLKDWSQARRFAATPEIQNVLRAYQQIGAPLDFAEAREILRTHNFASDDGQEQVPRSVEEAMTRWSFAFGNVTQRNVNITNKATRNNQRTCLAFLLHWMVSQTGDFVSLPDDQKNEQYAGYRDWSKEKHQLALPDIEGSAINTAPKWRHNNDHAKDAEMYNRAYVFMRFYLSLIHI